MYPTHAAGSQQHSTAAYVQQTQANGVANSNGSNGRVAVRANGGGVTTNDSGMYRTSLVIHGSGSSLSQNSGSEGETQPMTGSLGTRQHRTSATQQQQYQYQPQPVAHDSRYFGSLERSNVIRTAGREATASPALVLDLVPSKFGSKRESYADRADSDARTQQMLLDNAMRGSHMPADAARRLHYQSPHHYQQQQHSHYHHHHQPYVYSLPVVTGNMTNGQDAGIPRSAFNSPSPVHGNNAYGADARIARHNSQLQQQQSNDGVGSSPLKKSTDNLQIMNVMGGVQYQRQPSSSSSTGSRSSYTSPLVNNQHMPVQQISNYAEESKPFELTDAYKYSERRRRQPSSSSSSRSQQQQHTPVTPGFSQQDQSNWTPSPGGYGSDMNGSLSSSGKIAHISRHSSSNVSVSARIPVAYPTHNNVTPNGTGTMVDTSRTAGRGVQSAGMNNRGSSAERQRGSKSAPHTPQMVHRVI